LKIIYKNCIYYIDTLTPLLFILNQMESNNTKKILAFLGLGCSVLTLIGTLCPACMLMAGTLSLTDTAYDWETMDTTMMVCFGSLFCLGLLFAIVVGGISVYYLLKKGK
jgi:hypothetical protein